MATPAQHGTVRKLSAMRNFLVPSCRLCGATSYRRVISRDADGRMTPSGLFQCSGCSVVFADPVSWRVGGEGELGPESGSPVKPLTPNGAALLAPGSTTGVRVRQSL